MKEELLKKIKSRGYWRVNFRPLEDKRLKLSDCRELIEKNSVELRGWDYPHFPRREGEDTGLEPGENFYEGWIDWWNHSEFWRMYESGQFVHYCALREDWFENDGWAVESYKKIKPGMVLNVIGSLNYQLTEIYEFLLRLTSAGVYDSGAQVFIALNNTKGRKLWVSDFMRADFIIEHKTGAENIGFEKLYTKEEIFAKSKELALEAILYFADHFGWNNPSLDVIKKDQEDLLNKKF